jgi:vacuolar-type H+-ATPase subunit C/Vma6
MKQLPPLPNIKISTIATEKILIAFPSTFRLIIQIAFINVNEPLLFTAHFSLENIMLVAREKLREHQRLDRMKDFPLEVVENVVSSVPEMRSEGICEMHLNHYRALAQQTLLA